MTASAANFSTSAPAQVLAVFLLALLVSQPGLSAEPLPGEILFEGGFEASKLTWAANAAGEVVPDLEGTRRLSEPGLPDLPYKDLLLLVPADRSITSIRIEALETHRRELPGKLGRSGPLVTDTGQEIFKTTLTDSGEMFPGSWGRFDGDHIWRGYRLASVRVYPVRRVGSGDEVSIEFLDRFAVRVVYGNEVVAGGEILQRERFIPGEAEKNRDILRSLVVNPGEVHRYNRVDGQMVARSSVGFEPTKTPSISGSPVSYLIITSNALAPAFQILADHKNAQGISTVVATTEFITANFRNGADIQETLRMFIQDAYAKWGLEYVLLGGDSDVLPPRYVNNSFYPASGSTLVPVDLYFACLDGTWNSNLNSEYGEPASGPYGTDDADFAEEVYLGRAPVSTPAQATVFVNKIITYETTPAGSTWPNRALFAAEVLLPEDYHIQNYIILDGAQFSDQQVNDHITPCTTMETMRMYETDDLFPWDTPLTRATLIDTLNTGRYGIFNQIGHGFFFNMSVADANFMTTDADNLTNGDHLFMLYALNCASAAFDNSCLLERFIQNPNGGSVCSLGSVRAAFPNNANNYQQEFFSYLYCTGETRVGKLVALSRLPFIGATTANYVDRWTFENYTLLGDPSLPIWTGVPATLDVAGPASLNPGEQTVNLTVTSGGNPVPGAMVCLAMGDEARATGTTDGLGQVALDFLPVSTGNATVTVTGKNLALKSMNIPVTSGSAYMAIYDMEITDDGKTGSAGNGNFEVDAGEIIVLTATLEEIGGGAATGLSGALSTSDSRVVIQDGSDTFPNVGAGGFTTGSGGFRVSFADSIEDGSPVTFQLDVASGGNHYLSDWKVVVKAPQVEPLNLEWDDADGFENGIVENGEQINLYLTLKNYGAGTADLVTGYLRTDLGNVVIGDSIATWSNLGLLEESTGSVAFSLAVTDTSQAFDCRVDIEDSQKRKFSFPVQIARPLTPQDILTDTSLGANVIRLIWDPPAGSGILGYNVYRSVASNGVFSRVNPDLIRGASHFRDDNLNQLTTYFYKVVSVDDSYIESAPSAIVERATAPAELSGFPVTYRDETSSPLAVGDIDGDGDREIIMASNQVHIWHDNGLELVDGDNDSQTLGPFTDFPPGSVLQPAGVTLYEFNGQPGFEMIVSERSPEIRIHIFTKDGSEVPGWPQSTTGFIGTSWNWAAPAVGDIDGDGDVEIVVATLNGRIWAWHHDGSEVRDGDGNPATNGFFYFRPGAQSEWSRSGPALVDLDGDGAKDIVFGTRSDDTGLTRLMALKSDATDVAGFPYLTNGPVGCSPVVGDLDNDGNMEIVFWDAADFVYVVQQDGTDYPGFPINPGFDATLGWISNPGLGDMDGDGMLEIVHTPNRTGLDSRIYIFDTDHVGGTSGQMLPGFPVSLPGSSEGSPMLGDIDGDMVPDIVHGIGGGDENAPHNLYAYHSDGSIVAGFPISLTGPLMPPVVITDLDGDQDVDIVYGGWDQKMHVWDMPFAYDRQHVPWPTYQGNMRRDGVYFPLNLVPVPDEGNLPANRFVVQPPYPNPFNPSTSIRLHIPAGGDLELAVYDLQGRRLRTLHEGAISSGWHTLVWDGRDDLGRGQASGVYFVKASSAGQDSFQKMTLVK